MHLRLEQSETSVRRMRFPSCWILLSQLTLAYMERLRHVVFIRILKNVLIEVYNPQMTGMRMSKCRMEKWCTPSGLTGFIVWLSAGHSRKQSCQNDQRTLLVPRAWSIFPGPESCQVFWQSKSKTVPLACLSSAWCFPIRPQLFWTLCRTTAVQTP